MSRDPTDRDRGQALNFPVSTIAALGGLGRGRILT